MATSGKLHITVKGCQLRDPNRSAQGKHSWSHWALNTLYCQEIKRWEPGLGKRISHTRLCSNSQSWYSPLLPGDIGRKRNCALVWEAHLFPQVKTFSPSWGYEGSQEALISIHAFSTKRHSWWFWKTCFAYSCNISRDQFIWYISSTRWTEQTKIRFQRLSKLSSHWKHSLLYSNT